MSKRLQKLLLENVLEVVFFKSDEITTDLICCEIQTSEGDDIKGSFFHEEMAEWGDVTNKLSELPDFDKKWFSKVVHPPFEASTTTAAFHQYPRRLRGHRFHWHSVSRQLFAFF